LPTVDHETVDPSCKDVVEPSKTSPQEEAVPNVGLLAMLAPPLDAFQSMYCEVRPAAVPVVI
jgi:hypothetical protein